MIESILLLITSIGVICLTYESTEYKKKTANVINKYIKDDKLRLKIFEELEIKPECPASPHGPCTR